MGWSTLLYWHLHIYIRHQAEESHVFVTFSLPYQAAFCPSINLQRYRQVSNIRRTLVGHLIDDHSDVVVASPVGAAPTTSSFSTQYLASTDWVKTITRWDEKRLSFEFWCVLYSRLYGISSVTWGWADLLGATEPIHASHVRTITRPVLCFCRDRLLSIAEHGPSQWDKLLHIFPLSMNLPSHWEKKTM